MLPVTMTSNCFGLRTSCIAALSTYMCDSATSGYSAAEPRDDFAPEDRRVEHVRLVDRAEALAAAARGLEADARDALDLRDAVEHRVEAFVVTRRVDAATARLAEVDVAGELADDHQVEPGDDVRLQRRGGGEFRIEQRRAQVGEQRQLLADPQDALLGPQRARQRVVPRPADGAHQHSVGGARQRERRRRQRMLRGVVAGAADRRGLGFDGEAFGAERASTLAASATISGPMPSPGEYGDLHAWVRVVLRGVDRQAAAGRDRAAGWVRRARAVRRAASPRTHESRRRAAA